MYDIEYSATPITIKIGNEILYAAYSSSKSNGNATFIVVPIATTKYSGKVNDLYIGMTLGSEADSSFLNGYIGYRKQEDEIKYPFGYRPDNWKMSGMFIGGSYGSTLIDDIPGRLVLGGKLISYTNSYDGGGGLTSKNSSTAYQMDVKYLYNFNNHFQANMFFGYESSKGSDLNGQGVMTLNGADRKTSFLTTEYGAGLLIRF